MKEVNKNSGRTRNLSAEGQLIEKITYWFFCLFLFSPKGREDFLNKSFGIKRSGNVNNSTLSQENIQLLFLYFCVWNITRLLYMGSKYCLGLQLDKGNYSSVHQHSTQISWWKRILPYRCATKVFYVSYLLIIRIIQQVGWEIISPCRSLLEIANEQVHVNTRSRFAKSKVDESCGIHGGLPGRGNFSISMLNACLSRYLCTVFYTKTCVYNLCLCETKLRGLYQHVCTFHPNSLIWNSWSVISLL